MPKTTTLAVAPDTHKELTTVACDGAGSSDFPAFV